MTRARSEAACLAERQSAMIAALFAPPPLPNPPQWARDRVDEICGGASVTDGMANIAVLRLAAYVAEQEGLRAEIIEQEQSA